MRSHLQRAFISWTAEGPARDSAIKNAFRDDRPIQDAIIRMLKIIGKAEKNTPVLLKEQSPGSRQRI